MVDALIILFSFIIGFVVAIPAQYIAYFFNLRGHPEAWLVSSAFVIGVLGSAVYLAWLLGA